MTAPTDLNLKLDPIERIIFDGVASRLQVVTGAPFVWMASSDTIQVVKRMFGNNKVAYPYGSLLLKSWTENTERGNTTAATRRGKISVVTTDQKRFYRVHYLPMDFSVDCKVVTASYGDVLRIANAIMFARRTGWLKFAATYGGNSFDVSVLPDPTLSFPESSGDESTAKEYELLISLTVGGYISYPDLLEGQVIDTLQEVVQLEPFSANSDPDDPVVLWNTPTQAERVDRLRFTDLPANLR